MSEPRQVYSSEFKSEAVELARTSGKPLREVERGLGLRAGLLKQGVRKAEQDGAHASCLSQCNCTQHNVPPGKLKPAG